MKLSIDQIFRKDISHITHCRSIHWFIYCVTKSIVYSRTGLLLSFEMIYEAQSSLIKTDVKGLCKHTTTISILHLQHVFKKNSTRTIMPVSVHPVTNDHIYLNTSRLFIRLRTKSDITDLSSLNIFLIWLIYPWIYSKSKIFIDKHVNMTKRNV